MLFWGGGGVEWANSEKCVVDCARWERGVDPRDKISRFSISRGWHLWHTVTIIITVIIINHFQEIEGEPEFCLKEIKTGITFFFYNLHWK